MKKCAHCAQQLPLCSRTVGLVTNIAAARALEQNGRTGDEHRFADAFASLEQELRRAQSYFTRLRAEQVEI